MRDASFIVTPEQKRLAKKHQSVSARHKMHTDGWKPSLVSACHATDTLSSSRAAIGMAV